MFTSTTPIRAVANCSSTHSGTFVAQTPKWSPGANPSANKPRATRSTAASNSAHVILAGGLQKTKASRCGCRRAVSRSACPIVRPSTQGAV